MNRKTVIEQGIEIEYDGLEGYLYRPNSDLDEAWLVIEEGNAQKVSWKSIWTNEPISPRPDLKYAEVLGLGELKDLTRMTACDRAEVSCPFCCAKYASRFEVRPAKSKCKACQGKGERAMYSEALVEAWLNDIRERRDIHLAVHLGEILGNGYWEFEVRRTIRALQLIEDDPNRLKPE